MSTKRTRRLFSLLAATAVVLTSCGGGDSSQKQDTTSRQRNSALTKATLESLLWPRYMDSANRGTLVLTNDNQLIMWGKSPKKWSSDWQMQYDDNFVPPVSHARVAALADTYGVAIDLDNKLHVWGAGTLFDDYTKLPDGLDLSKVESLFPDLGVIGAIDTDGKLWTWGPGVRWGGAIPESVSALKITSYSSFNAQYSMALDEDGKVHTWGNDIYPMVGRIREKFANVTARSIYTKYNEAFVVTTDGEVLLASVPESREVQLFKGIDVQQVVETDFGTYVALDTSGKIHVSDVGYNYGWQSGIDQWNNDVAGQYGDVLPTLEAGQQHVAVLYGGYVYNLTGGVWINDLVMPELFQAGQFVSPIAAGQNSTYAIDEDFTINAFHSAANVAQPPAPEGSDFMAVAAGWTHNLALHRDGTVATWGNSPDNGRLPEIAGRVTKIGAGYNISAALDNYGNIYQWGQFYSPANTIKERPNDSECVYYHSMKVGFNSVIALGNTCNGNNSVLHVWGDNSYGQADVPDDLNISDVTDLAASEKCMAVVVNEKIRTWGTCPDGQSDAPDGVNFSDVELGVDFAVGVTTDGELLVWGRNVPAALNPPAGLEGVVDVSVGYQHIVVSDWSGEVTSWGSNQYGESTVPAKFKPLPPYEDMPSDYESMYPTARENSEAAAESLANPVQMPSVVDDVTVLMMQDGTQTEVQTKAEPFIPGPDSNPKTITTPPLVMLPADQSPLVSVGAVVSTSEATKRLGLPKVSGVAFTAPSKATASKVCTVTAKSVTVKSAGVCNVKVTYTDSKKKKRTKALSLIAAP